jgi:hypothetical protein
MTFLYHILLLLSVNLAPVSAWDVGQLVKTTSGPVLGHKSPRYKDVSEYLGNNETLVLWLSLVVFLSAL